MQVAPGDRAGDPRSPRHDPPTVDRRALAFHRDRSRRPQLRAEPLPVHHRRSDGVRHPSADGEPGDRAPERLAGAGRGRAGRRCPAVRVAAEHLRALDPRALRAPPGDPAGHGGDRDGARVDLLHPDGDRSQQRDRRCGSVARRPVDHRHASVVGVDERGDRVDHPGLAGPLPRDIRARRRRGGRDSRALVCHPHCDARHPRRARSAGGVVLGAPRHAPVCRSRGSACSSSRCSCRQSS